MPDIDKDAVKQAFPAFYDNPEIKRLSSFKKWTVSSAKKVPMDMNAMYAGVAKGASEADGNDPLDTIDNILTHIPLIANHALKLSAYDMGVVVLDIEPGCPDDIKADLLRLPFLYGEHSMSGKGYHLLFTTPKSHADMVLNKVAVKDEGNNKYYEFLLNHYVTFTRNTIPLPVNPRPYSDFVDIWNRCCEAAPKVALAAAVIPLSEEAKDYPYRKELLGTDIPRYAKTPYDFSTDKKAFDTSSYEFGYAGFLYHKLLKLVTVSPYSMHKYTDDEMIYMLYDFMVKYIPYRVKHESKRQGMPYLLYIAKTLVEKDVAEAKARRRNRKKKER